MLLLSGNMSAFSLCVCSNVPFTAGADSVCPFVTGLLHSPCVQAHPCVRVPLSKAKSYGHWFSYFLSFSCIHPFVAVKGAAVNMGAQIPVWIPFLFGWVLRFYLYGYLFIQQGLVFIPGPRAFEANPPALSCITNVWSCLLHTHLQMGLQFWLWFFCLL